MGFRFRNCKFCDDPLFPPFSLRFTASASVSVDMMFQMVHSMGFDLHFHEVRKLMYLVEARQLRTTWPSPGCRWKLCITSPGKCLRGDERSPVAGHGTTKDNYNYDLYHYSIYIYIYVCVYMCVHAYTDIVYIYVHSTYVLFDVACFIWMPRSRNLSVPWGT